VSILFDTRIFITCDVVCDDRQIAYKQLLDDLQDTRGYWK